MEKKEKKESLQDATTEEKLERAIGALTKLEFRPLPGFDPNIDNLQYYRIQQKIDCDEVYPSIYIGNDITAKNKKYLNILNITHLLNAAEGKEYGYVDTDSTYYADTTIKYLGLPIADSPFVCIAKYFDRAANFIDEALFTGGNVFVHCKVGISRSATCIIAYLMIKKRMLAIDAIRHIRAIRDIHPNYGFLRQLADLDNNLRKQRFH